MKFNIQQENGILKYATEEEVKVALNVPDDSNLKVIRKESRGSATYDFGLTELTNEETSSLIRFGFYDSKTDSYPFGGAPIINLYKQNNPAFNRLEFSIGDETVGTNAVILTPDETRLTNQAVYQNPSWELEDNTIPHWKAVTDYVDSKPTGATSLQALTTGAGNNTTSNTLLLRGVGQLDVSVDGGVLGYDTANKALNLISVVNGTPHAVVLGKHPTENYAIFGSASVAMTGKSAIQPNEFVTKSQLDNSTGNKNYIIDVDTSGYSNMLDARIVFVNFVSTNSITPKNGDAFIVNRRGTAIYINGEYYFTGNNESITGSPNSLEDILVNVQLRDPV